MVLKWPRSSSSNAPEWVSRAVAARWRHVQRKPVGQLSERVGVGLPCSNCCIVQWRYGLTPHPASRSVAPVHRTTVVPGAPDGTAGHPCSITTATLWNGTPLAMPGPVAAATKRMLLQPRHQREAPERVRCGAAATKRAEGCCKRPSVSIFLGVGCALFEVPQHHRQHLFVPDGLVSGQGSGGWPCASTKCRRPAP